MPARALPPPNLDAEADLAALLKAMSPDELEAFARELPADDRMLLEHVMGEAHAIGWRADPITFAAHLDPALKVWRYQQLLGEAFARAVAGTSPRLIINVPSRMGKTTVLRWGVTWGLDRTPGGRWIWVSYGDQLALESAYGIRDNIRQHAGNLRVRLRRDRSKLDRFWTDQGGGLLAAGINTAIIGFGAGDGGGMVIDDPMKNWQEAHSETARQRCAEQYFGTLRHRLDSEDAPLIICHARWHEDDLTGRLKDAAEQGTGEQFEVIALPSLAVAGKPDPLDREPGEPIEPERFTADEVRRRHFGMGSSYLVAALEQQDPLPPEGKELLREWFVLATSSELPTAPEDALTCMPAGTLVFTDQGPRPIQEVRVGDSVWSLDQENGKTFRLARVWRSECTGSDRILRIETNGRTVRCNADHRLLVRRKRPSPRSGSGGYKAVEWRTEWVRAGEVTTADFLVAAHGLPDGTNDTAPNGRLVTEGFMAFAGLMIGDGSVLRNTIAVARHAEAPYADAYKAFASAEFRCFRGSRKGIQRGAPLPKAEGAIHWIDNDQSMVFSSASAAREMRELGFSGVATTKRVPGWVFGLRPDLILAFLRGYLDSDGAVNTRGHVTYSSVNRLLLEDVRHLCLSLGIPTSTVCRYATAGPCVIMGRECNRLDMFQVFLFDPSQNRRIGAHHPVKAARLLVAKKKKGGRGDAHVDRWSGDYEGAGSVGARPGEGFKIDGARLVRVKAITVEESEPVYDLGVEGTHSFIADGAVVHNSWDLKLKDREAGDYVVGQVWWRVSGGYWLMDQLRGHYDHATTANAIALLAVRHPEVKRHVVEAAGSSDEVLPQLRKPMAGYAVTDEMAERLAMTPDERAQVEQLRRRGMTRLVANSVKGDKSVRARAYIAPYAEPGHVRIPADAPWVGALLDELSAFPEGAHDDQVDAMSQALQKLVVGAASVSPATGAVGRPRPGAHHTASGPAAPRPQRSRVVSPQGIIGRRPPRT